MRPKVAYLIDENVSWDNEPSWQFYPENDVPQWRLGSAPKHAVKRIVYWEIEDDQ
jgi:hypothetical protein